MSNETEAKAQPPVGIDLGTTYSVVSYLDTSGRPVTLLNAEGEMLTPSAVLSDNGEIVVGREAVRASVMEPHAYAECFKRDIGSDVYHRQILGTNVPPEVLSAFILQRLKVDAEKRLGPIRHVVITVPAFFDESRRQATQRAGRLAGLEVLDIINEPTAAAVAYGYYQGFLNRQQLVDSDSVLRILVYDLGGGTFDVTILEITGTEFRAVATDGDVKLGGKDFDERLVDFLAEQFLSGHGVDPRSDPQDAAQLWLDAQEAKHCLSQRTRTSVVVFHAGVRMKIEVTRDQLEDLTRDLVERTESTIQLLLKEAKLDWSQIDRLLLVGGSSRMPMITDMLRQVSGKEPDVSLSPDEVVSHGAALYAAQLMNRDDASGLETCRLVNVNSHSLGIVGLNQKTRRRENVILIPKNSSLPCRVSRVFVTAKDDQRNVRVAVVEGESRIPEHCIPLGECVVRDLPPGLPKGTRVQVEYAYAANGTISIGARVPSARQSARVQLERHQYSGLEDLDSWRLRLSGTHTASGSAASDRCPVDENNPSNLLRRLDVLYGKIGQAALAVQLLRALRHRQAAARAAASKFDEADAVLKQVESERQTAVDRAESIRLGSALAQARGVYEQARTQSEFALLVLGRECVARSVQFTDMDKEIDEVRELQARLT